MMRSQTGLCSRPRSGAQPIDFFVAKETKFVGSGSVPLCHPPRSLTILQSEHPSACPGS